MHCCSHSYDVGIEYKGGRGLCIKVTEIFPLRSRSRERASLLRNRIGKKTILLFQKTTIDLLSY